MARILAIDPDAVVGKLLRLWGWIDTVSVDGVVDGVVDDDVDRICRLQGFSIACESVGWLLVDREAERVSLPNFDTHNGETAKQRALKNRRQAKWRQNVDVSPSTPASTTASTREEKRREESKEKEAPSGAVSIPDVDASVVADFLKIRKAKKAPLTETALAGLRREAAKAGVTLEQALRVCCERGWSGYNATWDGAVPTTVAKGAEPGGGRRAL